jgi:hypothetical protein
VQHFDAFGELIVDETAGDYVKLLGVYSSHTAAAERVEEARPLPGFCLDPTCFYIDEYVVDANYWPEGFQVLEE